jgi:hypothetical protein
MSLKFGPARPYVPEEKYAEVAGIILTDPDPGRQRIAAERFLRRHGWNNTPEQLIAWLRSISAGRSAAA